MLIHYVPNYYKLAQDVAIKNPENILANFNHD